MTQDKDFKRLIRKRMEKTGESYTAARAQMLARRRARDNESLAGLAGISHAAVCKATGQAWSDWVEQLDADRAWELEHREIARHVASRYEISGWWVQSVVVGYERIKGLRDLGQRRGGDYDANKSKTLRVPVEALYKAFSNARQRARWLEPAPWDVRKATPYKSIRLNWQGKEQVQLYFTSKPDGKDGLPRSTIQVQHGGLASKEDAARTKIEWNDRLEALAVHLS